MKTKTSNIDAIGRLTETRQEVSCCAPNDGSCCPPGSGCCGDEPGCCGS